MTIVCDSPVRSLRYRQAMTVLLLFAGYGALYFCRADLSVSYLVGDAAARQWMGLLLHRGVGAGVPYFIWLRE